MNKIHFNQGKMKLSIKISENYSTKFFCIHNDEIPPNSIKQYFDLDYSTRTIVQESIFWINSPKIL